MGRKISIVLFWTIIFLSVITVSRITWGDWRGSLRVGVFVVPFVLLTSWLRNRFLGQRRRIATVMICCAGFAMASGSVLFWDWTLFRSGFEIRGKLSETLVAGALFVVSSAVLIWSFCRLFWRADKLPT
jgi:hypothetical protein